MPAESIAALVSVPAAVAVIWTVKLFLQFISSERDRDRATWGNHLSESIKVLQSLLGETQEMRSDLKEARMAQAIQYAKQDAALAVKPR